MDKLWVRYFYNYKLWVNHDTIIPIMLQIAITNYHWGMALPPICGDIKDELLGLPH